ncbi:MAG: MOSC domain-containing protein [Dehalococcoidia bacterium]
MRVAALYRYPVKGFTPEASESLEVLPDGRIAGDRVLGFRFASTPEPDDAWSSKHGMAVLVNTPGIARIQARYDGAAGRLALSLDGTLLAEDDLSPDGRKRLCDAVTEYVMSLPENPLSARPDHLPLRLVGDGTTNRLTDRPPGYVTLHCRASVSALGAALGDDGLDERRFRHNVAIDDAEAWVEQDWQGRRIRIGEVEFEYALPVIRCLATHANPATGERDREILKTLPSVWGGGDPILGIALNTVTPGIIRVGDSVEVLG